MPQDITDLDAERHDALYSKGWSLIEGRVFLHGAAAGGRPGWFSRWQLGRAIKCFEQALGINPQGWQSMWALGKIYQRLGEHAAAFDWFSEAHVINPDQPDVTRETGIAALEIGRVKEALELCRAAATSKPDDLGLICNLALALCLAGQDLEAEKYAASAVERDPSDSISATVLGLVREVASGKRQRPKQLSEVFL